MKTRMNVSMRKFAIIAGVLGLAGCASMSITVPEKGYNWILYQPEFPQDVPAEVYSRLWDLNEKVIGAGKYDYDAYNFNTAQFITFDESALSEDFTFTGVCMNYADYFIFLLLYDNTLRELYDQGVIIENISPTHKWIEYRTEKNRYIIDPTWCDWDYVGKPAGIYVNNAKFAQDCMYSSAGDELIKARSKEWFFRNVKTITNRYDRKSHGL
jgi:hypothetical protein